ncbi:uncharacterized protein LOC128043033 [Gossypium raimondii]|uniref:uncharacterized protein LOC128043033 n=1 Tax=Gossypium raimondii TaxID=29730 RepID=UPI00227ABAF3|nr:uncharacterized protein LOC128043033 [Gossypium raimondii]
MEVVMIGERRNYLANVISALVVEKLVRKGCEAYLAYVSVSAFGDSTVKDIRTVRDFSDVFPEELLGLPPNRKVEFGIELLPGTVLMSIVPYRMAPKELTELKAQIQELLDRGFIRPSYYRRFVEGFSLIAGLLTKLLSKGVLFDWTNAQQESFEKLKTILTEASVLVQPGPGKEFTKKLHEALGSRLDFSTAVHPQTNGQSEMIEDKVRLIRDRLKAASDRQKSYLDLKRHEIEYFVWDLVFLKVSPWKKVLRFGRKCKLSPQFIRPYHILKHVGPVAYQLELPPESDHIHDVFYVSIVRRYYFDPSHVVSIEEIEVRPDLNFEEEPVQILERDVKVLQKKSIPLVKVL